MSSSSVRDDRFGRVDDANDLIDAQLAESEKRVLQQLQRKQYHLQQQQQQQSDNAADAAAAVAAAVAPDTNAADFRLYDDVNHLYDDNDEDIENANTGHDDVTADAAAVDHTPYILVPLDDTSAAATATSSSSPTSTRRTRSRRNNSKQNIIAATDETTLRPPANMPSSAASYVTSLQAQHRRHKVQWEQQLESCRKKLAAAQSKNARYAKAAAEMSSLLQEKERERDVSALTSSRLAEEVKTYKATLAQRNLHVRKLEAQFRLTPAGDTTIGKSGSSTLMQARKRVLILQEQVTALRQQITDRDQKLRAGLLVHEEQSAYVSVLKRSLKMHATELSKCLVFDRDAAQRAQYNADQENLINRGNRKRGGTGIDYSNPRNSNAKCVSWSDNRLADRNSEFCRMCAGLTPVTAANKHLHKHAPGCSGGKKSQRAVSNGGNGKHAPAPVVVTSHFLLTATMGKLKLEMDRTIKKLTEEKNAALAAANDMSAKCRGDIADLQQRHGQRDNTANEKIDELKETIVSLNNEVYQLKQENDTVVDYVQESQDANNALTDEIASLKEAATAQTHAHAQRIADLEREWKNERQQLQQNAANFAMKNEEYKILCSEQQQQLAELSGSQVDLLNAMNDAKAEQGRASIISEQNEELDKELQRRADLQEELTRRLTASQQQVQRLQDEKEGDEDTIQSLEAVIAQLEQSTRQQTEMAAASQENVREGMAVQDQLQEAHAQEKRAWCEERERLCESVAVAKADGDARLAAAAEQYQAELRTEIAKVLQDGRENRDALYKQIEVMDNEKRSMAARVTSAEGERAIEATKLSSLQRVIDSHQSELRQMREERQKHITHIQELENKVVAVKTRASKVETEGAVAALKLQNALRKNEELSKTHKRELERWFNVYRTGGSEQPSGDNAAVGGCAAAASAAAAAATDAAANAQTSSLGAPNAATALELRRAQNRVYDLETEVSELTSTLKLRETQSALEVGRLQEQRRELMQESADAQADARAANDKLRRSVSEKEAVLVDNKRLHQQLVERQESLNAAHAQVQRLQQEQRNTTVTEATDTMHKQRNDAAMASSSTTSSICDNADVMRLQIRCNELEQTLRRNTDTFQQISQQDQSEVTRLRKDIRLYEDAIEEAQITVQRLGSEIAKQGDADKTKTEELRAAQHCVQMNEARIADQLRVIDALRSKERELVAGQTTWQVQHTAVQQELATLREQQRVAEDEYAQRIVVFEQQIEHMQTTINDLTSQLALEQQLHKQCVLDREDDDKRAVAQIESLTMNVDGLRAEKITLTDSLDKAQEALAQQQASISQLVSESKSEATIAAAKNEHLKEQMQTLNDEVQQCYAQVQSEREHEQQQTARRIDELRQTLAGVQQERDTALTQLSAVTHDLNNARQDYDEVVRALQNKTQRSSSSSHAQQQQAFAAGVAMSTAATAVSDSTSNNVSIHGNLRMVSSPSSSSSSSSGRRTTFAPASSFSSSSSSSSSSSPSKRPLPSSTSLPASPRAATLQRSLGLGGATSSSSSQRRVGGSMHNSPARFMSTQMQSYPLNIDGSGGSGGNLVGVSATQRLERIHKVVSRLTE